MKHSFLFGAAAYPLLELIYRRRTHYSMAIAGGISVWLIDKIRHLPGSLPAKSLVCGLSITGIEYLCGCIWNRDYSVWDYRRIPLNVKGQIALPFTLVWCCLSGMMLVVMKQLNQKAGQEIACPAFS